MPDSLAPRTAPIFPGTTLRRNSTETAAVLAVQQALNARGCGPVDEDGAYGPQTEAAVRLFQARAFDAQQHPLTVDGMVGPVTWVALFGATALPPMTSGGALAKAALAVAMTQIGVREKPPLSNRGEEVEAYLASVGVPPGNAWCAAFVYFCATEAARKASLANPLPRTGGVLDMWRKALKAGLPCLTTAQAVAAPGLVSSGMIFIMDFGEGKGHTGFVKDLAGGRLATIEGNSNDDGSRDGVGVFALTRRTLGSVNTGFIGLP
ncbi:peptidoglycan-binding protein [Dankookia sp. GCM10030260]|uniref:peptidoglycan-binding protein n=1 Tax=Dankookia sp. GCM10030260 TaxID=3273390 RepID=UPI00361BAA6F